MHALAPKVNPMSIPPLTLEQRAKLRSHLDIYFREVLGVERLEVYHKRILTAFNKYDRIAIAATHSVALIPAIS